MPRFAAALTAGTVWKVAGLNSNESRTRFAPTASRPDASSTPTKRQETSIAPPTTPKSRALGAAGLTVSVASAVKRPSSVEAHGPASITPSRSRSGQTSSVAASNVNEAVPPRSSSPERQAWCAPSTSAGDQTDGRSRRAMAKNATPGMSPGAAPMNDSAAIWPPKLSRFGESAPESSTDNVSPFLVEPRGRSSTDVLGGEVVAGPARLVSSPSRRAGLALAFGTDLPSAVLASPRVSTDAGSSVTAMINATASAASVQLRAWTLRVAGWVPAAARVTAAATPPPAATPAWTRIVNALRPRSATKCIRGERARTLAITSAWLVQRGSASTSRCAETTATVGWATAVRSCATNVNAASGNDECRALYAISAYRSIAG